MSSIVSKELELDRVTNCECHRETLQCAFLDLCHGKRSSSFSRHCQISFCSISFLQKSASLVSSLTNLFVLKIEIQSWEHASKYPGQYSCCVILQANQLHTFLHTQHVLMLHIARNTKLWLPQRRQVCTFILEKQDRFQKECPGECSPDTLVAQWQAARVSCGQSCRSDGRSDCRSCRDHLECWFILQSMWPENLYFLAVGDIYPHFVLCQCASNALQKLTRLT